MAWVCPRCEKKIYESREGAIRFAFVWKYVKIRDELTVDLYNINDIKERWTVTHIQCDPDDPDGVKERMRKKLGIPEDRDHPLLV